MCDNMAVVWCGTKLLPKDPHLAFLIRELALIAVKVGFRFRISHIPGVQNVGPDALSRGRWDEFRRDYPDAALSPTPIPSELLNRLLTPPV